MNTSILLVGHGSRHTPGNDEIKTFSKQWQAMNPTWNITTCFIEFSDILLDEGLDLAASASEQSGRVIVVPLILNAAGHVKMEIPHHIAEARQRHTDVEFIYAPHLGANNAILNILKRSLRKVLAAMHMPDPKTTGVILLGRGASDRVANGELAKMARWMFDESDHEHINIAFTGITYPRLEAVVQQQVTLGMTQIAILPYYLFTGTLIERIKQQVARLQKQYSSISIECGKYFGFEAEIFELLNQRVLEANGVRQGHAMMECDACHYRLLSEDQQDTATDDALVEQAQGIMACDGCVYRDLAEAQGHGHHHHAPHEAVHESGHEPDNKFTHEPKHTPTEGTAA